MNLPDFSVKNPVAVNLLMWAILVSGFYFWNTMVREFFPKGDPEKIAVTLSYPGATPEEVEKTITRRIEREIEDVKDIKKIESKVFEGATTILLTLEEGADRNRVLSDLRGELDKVKPELPDSADDPEITELRPFIPVIAVVVFGNISEKKLGEKTRSIKEDLTEMPEISEVLTSGIRDREIWVEIKPENLEKYRLTFEEVGQAIAQSNLDLPGGQLSSDRGNVRVRTLGEDNRIQALEQLIIRGGEEGNALRLKDLGEVRETFEDKVEKGRFFGKSASTITVFKAPEQDALKIAARVKNYIAENSTSPGDAIEITSINNFAKFISQRLELMTRNARAGLVLVVIALAFFLNIRVAFWVAAGIPISFMGTFVLMKILGASINLISLFGLIVVLGLIVDDAIVVGENVYTKIEQGMAPFKAAVLGTNEVAIPVITAVLTTMVTFIPLAFIEGRLGTFLGVLPVVVISALAVSLLEAFVILPAHLGHLKFKQFKENESGKPTSPGEKSNKTGILHKSGQIKKRIFSEWVHPLFENFLRVALRWRYITVTIIFSFSLVVVGLVASRRVPFVFIQKMDSENITINLEMAVGTTEEATTKIISKLEEAASKYREVKSMFSVIGTSFSEEGRKTAADPATVGQVNLQLLPAEEREENQMRTSLRVIADMREKLGHLSGIKKLQFIAQSGGPQGPDIEILARGDTLEEVSRAVEMIKGELSAYQGVIYIEDNLNTGKQEIRVRLREEARALGLTTRDLALQVRHALFGFEVQEIQEEDEEIKLRTLLPKRARHNFSDLARLRIVNSAGNRIPLKEVAVLSTSRGYGSLSRVDGKRAVTITAEVDEDKGNISEITNDLSQKVSEISRQHPGVSFSFEGRKKEMRESLGSLRLSFPAALVGIFAIIAILFRSYIQPIIIMMVIPFAMVGAILGHYIMGYPFTFLSMIGCVALAGISVNDSLILVDFINRLTREGQNVFDSVVIGAKRRSRAIILTSITTLFGLGPLMLERSFQAQFLIPMAISIVFGVAFATALILVMVPCFYLILEDFRALIRWLLHGTWSNAPNGV